MLCVYDDDDLAVQATFSAADTCDSGSCWSLAGTTGYQYKNKGGNDDSITKVKLKTGTEKAQIQVAGKGGGLSLALPLADTTAVVVHLQRVDSGGASCWTTSLPAPALINDGAKLKFKDKTP